MHHLSSLVVLASTASAAMHTVMVGKGGLVYSPNTVTAAMGDTVEFVFESEGHSVAQGAFSTPCQPAGDSAFYSGFVMPGAKPWTLTVDSTDPMWFYCSQISHCQSGMVGVINPPSGMTADDFAKAAMKTSGSKSPAKVQGGVFGSAPAMSSSPASMASSMMASSSMAAMSSSAMAMSTASTMPAMSSMPAASTPAATASPTPSVTPSTGDAAGKMGWTFLGISLSAVVFAWSML